MKNSGKRESIEKADEMLFPLSKMELSIWLGQQRHADLPLYNMAMLFEIKGEFDVVRFNAAFEKLVISNEVMRSTVVTEKASAYIKVLDEVTLNIDYLDFSQEISPLAACKQYYRKRCQELIDISRCNFDVSIAKVSEKLHCWFLNQHHLFTDIASLELVYRSVSESYLDLDDRITPQRYTDIGRPIEEVASDDGFSQKLNPDDSGFDTEKRINLYGISRSKSRSKAYRIESSLGASVVSRMTSMLEMPEYKTLSQDLTRFCLFSTGIVAFLARIGDKTNLTLACPAQNRSKFRQKSALGMFIQMLPFQVSCLEGDTFSSLYPRVQTASIEYMKKVASNDGGGSELRDISIVWNMIQTKFGEFGGMPAFTHWLDNGHIDSQHDLRIQILNLNNSEEWDLYFDVSCDVFDRVSGEKAISHFKQFLNQLFENPNTKITELQLAGAAEQALLLQRSERTLICKDSGSVVFQSANDILKMLKKHSIDRPHGVAARNGEHEIKFSELEVESNKFAVSLNSMAQSSKVVAIYMPRSIELLVAIIAVLKAGAAYVPLDSSWPKKRVERLCGLANVDCIITDEGGCSHLEGVEGRRVSINFQKSLQIKIDEVVLDQSSCADADVDLSEINCDDAAYIIFTSGSSGEPKGVTVSHKCLNHYVSWAARKYVGDDQKGDFALHSSIGFDLTITSIFVPLWLGATVYIYPESAGKGDFSVLDAYEDDKAEIIKLTPAHLSLLIEMNKPAKHIKTLILGGENLSRSLAIQAKAVFGEDIHIFNEYGPTEAVVGCMWHEFDPDVDKGVSVPIGCSAEGVAIYLFDGAGNPVPDGVVGEMFIGGDRLADGYLHDAELTSRKFLKDPRNPERKIYQSGDLACFTLNQEMIYLGRQDNQVKIRGARVEVEEVRSAMMLHQDIAGCHVTAMKGIARPELEKVQHCQICGLGSDYPGIEIDSSGKCHVCKDFDHYRDRTNNYFKELADFKQLVSKIAGNKSGSYDCLVLLSGGKDSTYALYSIARMGFSIFAMTLDNGYISEGAKTNIRLTVEDLQVHHEFVSVGRMNEIFADSLKRHSSVCYGCFKTIYTLSINMAHQYGIPVVITGLSRGQLFETRLNKVTLVDGAIDAQKVDNEVLENRKIYHRIEDKVTEVLNMDLFASDDIFDQVQFVDFYRYCDVSMEEMYQFLEQHAPWTRPKDTGRSTNCLINDTGIYVHKKKLGYHNYALPYSWDVRLGHKERDSALEELNDRIDAPRVKEILEEIDYQEPEVDLPVDQPRIVAYFSAKRTIGSKELRGFVNDTVADAMVPSYFVQVDKIPLTVNGKVDVSKLPDPRFQRPKLKQALVLPASETETLLAEIWQGALRIKKIGVHDNFFELGGDSIIAIQIVANVNRNGLKLTPNQIFQNPTVFSLSSSLDLKSDLIDSHKNDLSGEAFSLLNEEEMDEIASLID